MYSIIVEEIPPHMRYTKSELMCISLCIFSFLIFYSLFIIKLSQLDLDTETNNKASEVLLFNWL